MKLAIEQLDSHLQQGLKPVYLVTGDEPLQHAEALDKIRYQAKQQGYLEREIITVDAHFEWSTLLEAANSLSLFASQRVLDVRLASPKLGKQGSQVLRNYLQQPASDIMLLLSCGRLEKSVQSSQWFRALEQQGVVLQVWPITGQALLRWLERRLTSRKLVPEPGVCKALLERVEGNLLAAAQEVDKLQLLYPAGSLSFEQLLASVADSSRYDVFTLTDHALAGNMARTLHILQALKAEGIATPIVLWALSRELRQLYQMACLTAGGMPPKQVIDRQRPPVIPKRKPLLEKALQRTNSHHWLLCLQRCAEVDQVVKGRLSGDAWQYLAHLCLQIMDFSEKLGILADDRKYQGVYANNR